MAAAYDGGTIDEGFTLRAQEPSTDDGVTFDPGHDLRLRYQCQACLKWHTSRRIAASCYAKDESVELLKFQCDECDMRFRGLKELNVHKGSSHTKIRCRGCGNEYHANALAGHMQRCAKSAKRLPLQGQGPFNIDDLIDHPPHWLVALGVLRTTFAGTITAPEFPCDSFFVVTDDEALFVPASKVAAILRAHGTATVVDANRMCPGTCGGPGQS